MMDEPAELPTLDPGVVEDDQLLGAVVDNVVRRDPVAAKRASEIAMHFGWLRGAVDPEAWKLVLEIEARTAERWADLAVVLVGYGWEQHRRFSMPPEGSP